MCKPKHKMRKTIEYIVTATLYWKRLFGGKHSKHLD